MKRLLLALLFLSTSLLSGALGDHHLETVKLEGVWHAKAESDNGQRDLIWTFSKDGDDLKGRSEDLQDGNERELDRIKVKGDKVTLEVDIEADGNEGIIIVETKQKADGKLSGEWRVEDTNGNEFMSGDISAWKEVAFAGEWDSVAETPNGDMTSLLVLKGANKSLKGMMKGDTGEIEIAKSKSKERSIRLDFSFEMNGDTIKCFVEAEAQGDDKLVGKWTVPDFEGSEIEGPWTAERKSPLLGKWKVTARVPNADEYHGAVTIMSKNGKLSSVSESDTGETTKSSKFSADGKTVSMSYPIDRDGIQGTIIVEAKLQSNGSLKGEWSLVDDDGQEMASDDWMATRD